MKILAYRAIRTFGRVTVAERASADLPLVEVLRDGIGSLEDLKAPGIMAGFARGTAADEAPPDDTGHSFSFRDDDGSERRVTGAVFYENTLSLAQFLLDRYVPTGGGTFNDFIRRKQEASTPREQLFDELELRIAQQLPPFVGRRHLRWDDAYPESPDHCLIDLNHFLKAGHGCRRELPAGDYFLRAASDDEPILVLPTEIRLGTATIPRLALLSPLSERHSSSSKLIQPFLLFDGERHRWLKNLDELSFRQQETFSQDAIVFQRARFDLFPNPHLKARCLVRISGQKEAWNLLERDLPQPRAEVLRHPAIVRESREPMGLGGNVPIVDAPEEACFVLSRMVRGIYLPGDAARRFTTNHLQWCESFLVLCEPGEIS